MIIIIMIIRTLVVLDCREGGLAVPEHNCDNVGCGRPFHSACLREWLQATSTTRQSFDTLFGACPYCSAPITVKAG
jgi:E3 ubiquitin-protein ligase FANCL